MKLIAALFIAFAYSPHALPAAENRIIDDAPEFTVKPATHALLKQLRDGGYVLYMRHGNSDITHPDQLPAVDLNDCSTQRDLTKEGSALSAYIGRKIHRAGIPVGEVISSPLCRAQKTALAAFGTKFSINNSLMYTAGMTAKDKIPVIEATRELISKPVEGKENRVIVSHGQPLIELIGYLPKPEGTIAVFQPMGNLQFKYIASIAPSQWGKLIYRAPLNP